MPRRTRPTTVFPAAMRELRVLRVADVTPGMRRVTLTGDELGAFTNTAGAEIPEFVSVGFDDDVRLFFAHPGQIEPVLPVIKPDGVIFPKEPRPLGRFYTVRRFDADARELDIDFVKHGVGVATTWAYRAQPGDRIHMGGPSCSLGIPEGFDWLLVAGDETAVPAIGRLLDELPADARARVFIEIATDAHRQDLRELAGVEVTWLPRDRPGTEVLIEAVTGAEWWPGKPFAWVAGEQAVVRDLRRHLVEVRHVPKGDIEFVGYWRREDVVAHADDPAVPDTDRNEEAYEKFHEKSELLPPLAIRVAVDLGVGDLISRGVTSVAELAERTGTRAPALNKLLRYLQAIDLLVPDADGYRLSPTGEFLADEYVIDELRSDGITARIRRGWEGLEYSVRTGQAAFAAVTGSTFAELRTDPEFENSFLEDISEYSGYIAEPLGKSLALAGKAHVVVHANGAGGIADVLTAADPATRVDIVALPTAAQWFRNDLPTTIPDDARRERVRIIEQSVFEASAAADVVLLVYVLPEHRDAEAVLVLQRAAANLAPGGRVLVLEEAFDTEELDEHDAEEDLLKLTLHGSGHRTSDELDALIERAGLVQVAAEPIGWGGTLRSLARR